ncbi:MAG: glutathione S-transferase family protein [Pseudomonadota bacterium]|nr:glutathione S-transferase family protein [Pseudomonadota bacterium]
MITLYGFGPGLGMYDPSPFVLKVAAFLRLANIDYHYNGNVNHLFKAPKKKLPYINDNGTIVCDSTFIISHLKNRYASDFDSHLSPEQQAAATLINKSLDENFYWCLVYFRWVDNNSWPIVKNALFGKLPFPLSTIVPLVARRGVSKQVYQQGTGRHNKEEVLSIARQTLDALSVLIGDNLFCLGDKPSSLDATVYAFLAEAILVKLDNDLTRLARQYSNLNDYCQRIQQQFFAR